ncbi:hypothetical protein G7046_g2781 [Stylonectria norvegica]|nr:hypothetical protein G7046_g2781 [Stylonectria norvegica]
MTLSVIFAGLVGFAAIQLVSAIPTHTSARAYCPVFYAESPKNCLPLPETFLAFSTDPEESPATDIRILEDAFNALVVLQEHYFESDFGTWPSAIDWTAAVAETIVSGMLTTLSKSLVSMDLGGIDNWKAKENLISSFYAQIVGSYFGQDVLSIRGQAYDDILWVSLGWIEAIKFVRTHASLHYPGDGTTTGGGLSDVLHSMPWHGHNWVCSFSHRARIFWNLGIRGWDTEYCNGGMIWNSRLNPYKNAITNQLWISASISMYEHFPGDNFTSPWIAGTAFPAKDPMHLAAAIEGYKWLMDIKMTNDQGLYVDGYHIDKQKPGNTKCDIRDEMVYTYNQGVLLTGQRGLWVVSGRASYLEDGHRLIQSVIAVTGWDLKENRALDPREGVPAGQLPRWLGLGRGGILEEQCDASGTCSQDGQTFKGIFFHHLTTFCAPLDPILIERGITVDVRAFGRVKMAHAIACKSYIGWIRHNTLAALATRDDLGRFGMWWGAGIFDAVVSLDNDGIDHDAANTTDYRNQGTPEDATWGENHRWLPGTGGWNVLKGDGVLRTESQQQVLPSTEGQGKAGERPPTSGTKSRKDANDRGLGRTMETQVGGLALLRAYWEMTQSF